MKRRIVIADDDPLIISLVSLRLEMAHYEVLAATNGKDALALIRNIALESKIPVFFSSLEQSRFEIAQRLLCCDGAILGCTRFGP